MCAARKNKSLPHRIVVNEWLTTTTTTYDKAKDADDDNIVAMMTMMHRAVTMDKVSKG